MVCVEQSSIYINIKTDDPDLAFPCQNNIIHCNVFSGTAEFSLQHHPFLYIWRSVKKAVQRFSEIFQFHICQIPQSPEINAQEGQASFSKIPYRPDQSPIAAQNNSLFTQDFAEERQRVIDAGGSDASIRQLLSRYGTHYVTTSTLGGYLDYYFSSSVDKISDTLDVNATIGFGYATTFNLNADVKYKDAFESFGEDKIESFLVKGGDAITLTNAVVAKTINNAALDAWLASFGGVEDDQGRLELINFEVNGIYELFPSDIKTKIRNYIERVMYYNDLPVTRSGNQDSFQN